LALSYHKNKGLSKIQSNNIKYVVKNYYEAISKSPTDYKKYLEEENKKWRDNYIKSETKISKPAYKIYLIKKLISESYGEYFAELISVPYYLKVKILSIKNGNYVSYSPEGLTVPKTVLVTKVENIVKGEERFKSGDTIEINIINSWMKNAKKFFVTGHEYFMPLRPFNCRSGNCEGVALNMLPDQNSSIYPIENNNIEIEDDYFQLGKMLNWKKFKELFSEKFIIK
jgi:hypothetical protein